MVIAFWHDVEGCVYGEEIAVRPRYDTGVALPAHDYARPIRITSPIGSFCDTALRLVIIHGACPAVCD